MSRRQQAAFISGSLVRTLSHPYVVNANVQQQRLSAGHDVEL
jgi:hypothetical protein